MPVYEYKCEKCGRIVADIIPWSNLHDPHEIKKVRMCEICDEAIMEKVMSVPAKPYVKW